MDATCMCWRQIVSQSIIEAVDACPHCGPMMQAARDELPAASHVTRRTRRDTTRASRDAHDA